MKIVLCLFVVVAFVATGEALKCYDCHFTNPKCDAFDSKDSKVIEKACPETHDACMKASAKFSNGTSVTLRGCTAAPQLQRAGVTVENESVFYCKSDLCNGVSSTGAALTTLMVLIAPLIFTNWY